MSSDFAWLIEHGPEIFEKYAGKWIAVHDEEVIGVGDTATEAANQARTRNPGAEFILEAVDRDADVIYAGLQVASARDGKLRPGVGSLRQQRRHVGPVGLP